MATVLNANVRTSESEGEQLLKVEADIGLEEPETFFYLRPLGTNTWFTLVGRGRAGKTSPPDEEYSEALQEIEEELVDQGLPIRPMKHESEYPDTGTVETQFSSGSFHRYPLFSDQAHLIISEQGNIDPSNVDASVIVEYLNEYYEYAIEVVEGDLPDDWVLKDIAIWADAIELGDTLRSQDDLRNPDKVEVHKGPIET